MMRFCAAAVCLVFALISNGVSAETYQTCKAFIDTVPAVVTTQGVYCLRSDLSTAQSTGAAITVSTNNVTIDCNGFKIGGLAAGLNTNANGIEALYRQNTTVRNCNVRGFRSGIRVWGDGILVENNSLDHNTENGVVVSGSANRVRGNLVLNTGGTTLHSSVSGFLLGGDVDLSDNQVNGVFASGGNVSAYGVQHNSGVGARMARNLVRNLVPSGTGDAFGIFSVSSLKVFIEDNRLSMEIPWPGSTAVRCNAGNGAMRDVTSWGFSSGNSGCVDDGGN
ncbi:MAG: hypothetical protein L0H23_07875, partial [Luteimonas sp.]|nr:hypothetical protein [Luteimonas sp.]